MATSVVYFVAAALLTLMLLVDKWLNYPASNLDAIPAVGTPGRLASFIGAYGFILNGQRLIEEGIRKYGTAAFRFPMMGTWVVVLSRPEMINDIKQAREEDLSFYDAANGFLQSHYMFGMDTLPSHAQVEGLRLPLTKNLGARFMDIKDEATAAFEDYMPKADDWVPVRPLDTVLKVVCRTSNRLFVGLPLGRDPDYCDLNIKFTTKLFAALAVLYVLPRRFHPFLGPLLSPLPRALHRCEAHLELVVAQRLEDDAELGNHREDRPNDLISWLIDATPDLKNTTALMKRVLLLNVATIHTTSHAFTQALLQLAARPEYIEPLREEVATIIDEEGWSKSSLEKMRKIDSFLHECFRWEGLTSLVMTRQVKNPSGYTLSDGTHLPQGTFVSCAGWNIHHSADNYVDPLEFDGLRFFRMHEEEEGEAKHQFATTSPKHLTFGHGRHACPGRFLAAIELKVMLAHVVLNYDVKLECDNLPVSRWIAFVSVVDKDVRVMFRKRQMVYVYKEGTSKLLNLSMRGPYLDSAEAIQPLRCVLKSRIGHRAPALRGTMINVNSQGASSPTHSKE